MPKIQKIFSEYGLDFDNNKYGFGHSTEYEYTDGSEMRTHKSMKFKKIYARYFRVWIGKIVVVIPRTEGICSSEIKKQIVEEC